MDINGYDTESLYDNDYFSPLKGGKEVEWGFGSIKDRKYIAFPVNKSYYSETKHGEVYHQFHCMSCGSELTDIFDRYVIEVSPDSYYCCDEDFEEASNKLNKVGMQFIRTCIPCFYSEDCGKIFAWKSKGYITYLGETRQFYVVNIGFTEKNYFLGNYQTVSSSEGKTFHQRLGAFLDNFDAGLADINESLIAGFFRTFGVIRDSVDFFVTVGELLKQKVGLSEPKEKELFASQYKLSEETANALMHIDKVTPLEIFRRIFPTGEEIKNACLSAMGIKYESNTAFKRVLESLSSGWLFGKQWMAISAIGQAAVESGFINEASKPFYEIGLAFLAHKASKIGGKVVNSLGVRNLGKDLMRSELDLVKIKSGDIGEISRAEKTVDIFLDTKELAPIEGEGISVTETRIPFTQANNVCGWKVGDPINNLPF